MGYNVLIVESVSDHGVGSLCLPGAKSGLIKKRGFLPLVLFSFPVGRQHYVINTIAQVKYNIYESCGDLKPRPFGGLPTSQLVQGMTEAIFLTLG